MFLVELQLWFSQRKAGVDANHDDWGRDKIDIRAPDSLISLYQNESSRVLGNGMETSVFFLEATRLQETCLSSSSFMLSLDPNWYMVIQIGN